MIHVTYGITEETYSLGQLSRRSYGIIAYADAEKDGAATIIASVHDITTDRKSLAELVSLCNRLELSPFHLNDVIEDFLAN